MPFTVKAIRAPQGHLSPAKFAKAILQARGIAEIVGVQELRATVRRWTHKPAFTIRRLGDVSQIVTDDPVFGYQDLGTRGPYPITPRRKRALFWKGARHPVRRVMHPGLQAQRFSARAADVMQRQYERIMAAELAKAIT